MKKGFTMIELIFVIVILGILAAIAVPKLNATRDDAEVAKGLSNFSTLINDLQSYYTAHGKFETQPAQMTNVKVEGSDFKTDVELPVKKLKCVKIKAGATGSESKITIEDGTDKDKEPCKTLLEAESFKAIKGTGTIDLGANKIF